MSSFRGLMNKKRVIGLCAATYLSLASLVADTNQYNGYCREKDIQGMLYYQKVPDWLINWIDSEIQSMKQADAIHWEDSAGRTRKTFEFGFSFKEMEKNHRIVKKNIPPFLVETRRQIVELFKDQLKEHDPEKYENCIITLYSAGDGIEPHTDRRYFGPDILGLIVVPDRSENPDGLPSCLYFTKSMCFEEPIVLSEEAGIAYLITGELRTAWNHELPPVASQRISIQFRTVDEELVADYIRRIY